MKHDLDTIVAACQRKETWAQKSLYEAFASQMLGVCIRYTHSRDEAQDILHDGFIKVFERIGKLQNRAQVVSWIYRIMVRESINYVSRRTNLVYSDMAGLSESFSSDDAVFDSDQYQVSDVLEALRQLPDSYRLMFNMHEVDDLDYAEISTLLGLPESTIRSGVYRARILLRDILSKNSI